MDIINGNLNDAHVDAIAYAVTGEAALERFVASDQSGDIGGSTLRRYLSDRLFSGEPGAIVEWPLPETFTASVMLFVGCGESSEPDAVRSAFGRAARRARNIGSGRLGIVIDESDPALLPSAVQGAMLGGWAFRRRLGTLRSDKVAPSAGDLAARC